MRNPPWQASHKDWSRFYKGNFNVLLWFKINISLNFHNILITFIPNFISCEPFVLLLLVFQLCSSCFNKLFVNIIKFLLYVNSFFILINFNNLSIQIWKVNSPLPVTDENMAWRSPNMPTGRSPGQVFISQWYRRVHQCDQSQKIIHSPALLWLVH